MLLARPSLASDQKTTRLEALSDGVFAIALTLLIIDVVATSKVVNPGEPLAEHLLYEWPSLLAYLVGFITILVSWVNHHRVFHYVRRADTALFWINGLLLALVSAVPFPTAVLAANLIGEGSRTAFLLFGGTYVLMAISFWGLWRYVDRRGLTDRSIDPERYEGVGRIYRFGLAWTLLCMAVALFNVYWAVPLWIILFAVFAFPAEFAQFTILLAKRLGTHTNG